MQAAEQVFRTRRFHEVTLEEVAQKADVGKGTIYLYFSDKDDLFFQTAVSGFDEMCELLVQSNPGKVPFRRELTDACRTISEFFRQRRPLFRMILSESDRVLGRGGSLRQRWLERRTKMTQALAEMLRRGVSAGEVRRDVPAEVLVEYLMGMLRTRATELDAAPEPLRGYETMVDLFVHGTAARPAREQK